MNLFQRFGQWIGRRNILAMPDSEFIRLLGGRMPTKSGASVSERTVYQCAAFLTGVRILSETVGSLSLKVKRRLPNGGQDDAPEHPLYSVLHMDPNEEYTSMEWREKLVIDCCAWGNHYDLQIEDGKGNVAELWPLDPGKMQVVRPKPDGPRVYDYHPGHGSPKVYFAREILHNSLLRGDGLKGQSLLNLCREAVGLTLTAEEFAALFFRNDATPRLVIETEQQLQPKVVDEMSKKWKEDHGGDKKHGTGWLWGGMEAKLLEADLSKLQLVDVRRFQLEEMARILRVPLHLMQSLQQATNNNIEHQSIDFVVHSIRPWLVRIEQRISKSLFGPREGLTYFAEFNVDSLLRGDYVSQTTGIARLVAGGVMMPNEGRKYVGLNPVKGGDVLLVNGTMVPLDHAGARYQQKKQK